LKIIFDLVFNHCSSTHPFWLDRPAEDWFHAPDTDFRASFDLSCHYSPYRSDHDTHQLLDGAFDVTMPDINQQNPDFATYLIQMSIWWIEASGIAGIRQDTFGFCDPEMMNRWVLEVRDEYPEFAIVAEYWTKTTPSCAFFQKGSPFNPRAEVKMVMDLAFPQMIRKATSEQTGDRTGLDVLHAFLTQDFCYPDIYNVMRLLDNHDLNRFLPTAPATISATKQAITVLLTVPGIPQIYYGTELLMSGVKTVTDGFIRLDFPGGWSDDKANCFTAEGRTEMQNAAWNFISTLLRWRKGNEVIAKGTMKMFKPYKGMFLYERRKGDQSVLVILNGLDRPTTVPLERYQEVLRGRSDWKDVVADKAVILKDSLSLVEREVLVLV
jgi:glycosidase